MKKHISKSSVTWLTVLFLLISIASLAQDSERKGFYASIQPGFVWIEEQETSNPILPPDPIDQDLAYTRIAMAIDMQVGGFVRANIFHMIYQQRYETFS